MPIRSFIWHCSTGKTRTIRRVLELARSFKGKVLTTQWVLTEVADAFAVTPERRVLRDKFRVLEEDADTEIVLASPDLFNGGLWLYNARPDKGRSLTDCISFVVMTDECLGKVLTGDHHFEQAGFRALLV